MSSIPLGERTKVNDSTTRIEQLYDAARDRYGQLGVDTDRAIDGLRGLAVSIHCWQGDDVHGFEPAGATVLGDGLAVTGNYPGRATTPDQLRDDLDLALRLIPGRHTVSKARRSGSSSRRRSCSGWT